MKPRVLVVEDAPVTRAFFLGVLGGLPVEADAAATCKDAMALARTRAHALWLVDAHLPDGDAAMLLPHLRAASPAGVALAHTASRDPALHASLAAAGFAAVLVKPIAAAALVAAIECHLPAWDDAGACAALGGGPDRVGELRALYAAELPSVALRVRAACDAGDVPAVHAELHRLAASCALAGARRMADAVRRLQRAPTDHAALREFLAAADEPVPL